MSIALTKTETTTAGVRRLGLAHESLRKLIGCWPFSRGTTKIPRLLGSIYAGANGTGVIGGVGAGDVLFPFHPGDLVRSPYWFLYEKRIRALLRQMLSPGSIFLDIGAHNGWHAAYALALVQPGGVVIACEPHPFHATRLKELAALNPGKRLDVHDLAISNRRQEVLLLASELEGWDTIHTVVPEFDTLFRAPRRSIPVTAITLDQLVREYPEFGLDAGAARVVIKVDAEGSELSILEGAAETLRLLSIRALIIECTGGTDLLRAQAIQCIEVLRHAKWKPMVLTDRGVREWNERDAETQVNVLALPV